VAQANFSAIDCRYCNGKRTKNLGAVLSMITQRLGGDDATFSYGVCDVFVSWIGISACAAG
jgi:hypothetical protein